MTASSVLEFSNNLWGLGTDQEQGCRTGPPGYIGWRNQLFGINSWALKCLKIPSLVIDPGHIAPVLKVPSGPARLDRPENGIIKQAFVRPSTALCLNYILNIFLEFKVLSRLIQKFILSPNSWEGGLKVRQPPSFPPSCYQKNARTIHFMLRGRCGVQGWEDGLCNTLTEFSSNKSELSNRKKDLHTNRPPNTLIRIGFCLK